MTLRTCLALSLCLISCGGSNQGPSKVAAPVSPPASESVADAAAAAPAASWWQGAEPVCALGTLGRRKLSWGSVYWCEVPGQKVDASLQNDLGRIARCVGESVGAFQQEPEPGKLGAFLARADEAGLHPVLCAAVRRDSEPRTYHGRTILLDRQEQAGEGAAPGEISVRYRFGCQDCLVAAETVVLVAR